MLMLADNDVHEHGLDAIHESVNSTDSRHDHDPGSDHDAYTTSLLSQSSSASRAPWNQFVSLRQIYNDKSCPAEPTAIVGSITCPKSPLVPALPELPNGSAFPDYTLSQEDLIFPSRTHTGTIQLGSFDSVLDDEADEFSQMIADDLSSNCSASYQHENFAEEISIYSIRSPVSTTSISTTPSSAPSGRGRRHARFTSVQRDIMQSWLTRNKDNPYPEKAEISRLAREAGLDRKQVRDWFTRTRSRKMAVSERSLSVADSEGRTCQPHCPVNSDSEDEEMGSGLIAALAQLSTKPRRGTSVQALSLCGSFSSTEENVSTIRPDCGFDNNGFKLADWKVSRLYWWLITLPDEASGFSEIVENNGPIKEESTEVHQRNLRREPTSNSEFLQSAQSQHASSATAISIEMTLSASPLSLIPRKGRRRHGVRTAKHRSSSDSGLSGKGNTQLRGAKYHCSFCDMSFERKSSCKRHEEAIHNPSAVWICSPMKGQGGAGCLFCTSSKINGDCPHDFESCLVTRGEEERTFFRRDNFREHLKGFHKVNFDEFDLKPNLDLWKRSRIGSSATRSLSGSILGSLRTK